jgi:hypothetical protein
MGLILLSACAHPFPAKQMFEVDVPNQVCGVYDIVDQEKVLFSHKEDRPLQSCNGVFGFSTSDTPKVIQWSRERIQEAKQKCGE